MSFNRVAVIGTGTIGAGWATWLLSRGLEVVAWDPGQDAENRLRRFIDVAWTDVEQLGLAPTADPTRLRFAATAEEACEGADFVQENAPEKVELKARLLARLDAATDPQVVIASSTSSLLMAQIQVECRRAPQRCILGHPFNPPHLMPLVEVSGSERTAPEALDRAMEFYRTIGKKPVRLRREVQGHIAGRLGAAAWREAVHLVAEGICDVADVDMAMVYGPGLRWASMGPHMTFHLGGGAGGMRHYLDHLGPSQERRWADLGTPSLTPEVCDALVRGVEDEAAGRTPEALARQRDRALVAVQKALNALDP